MHNLRGWNLFLITHRADLKLKNLLVLGALLILRAAVLVLMRKTAPAVAKLTHIGLRIFFLEQFFDN